MTPAAARVIAGGQVVDGTGAEPFAADLRVVGDRIVGLGRPGTVDRAGAEVLDAAGLTVVPGFVDIHTHADFSLPTYPSASSMVRQGVTTLVVGNCGFSPFPVGPGQKAELLRRSTAVFGRGLAWEWQDLPGYARALEATGVAVNVAPLVGHGAVRIATLGYESRAATPEELDRMRALVEAAMVAGAHGMSSGLIYPPASYAPTDELVELCSVVAAHGGVYSTHLRNEGEKLLEAVDEALMVARRSGVRLQLSHHKVLGRRNWGLTSESLERIDAAVAEGLDLALDQYPYPASSTTMLALVPPWAAEGGPDGLAARLADSEARAAIRTEILDGPADGRPKRDFEPETVMISSVGRAEHRHLVGMRLDEVAAKQDVAPVDGMLDLLAADPAVEVVIFAIGDEDIERVMRHSSVAVASDGWTLRPEEGGNPHPRSYGTFARVLEKYVREQRVLELPEAIRRMTTLPASRMGLADRGRIAIGAIADLAVIDPAQVRERATFLDPHQYADGVQHVWVAGTPVVRDGEETGARPGRVLLRRAGDRPASDERDA